MVTQARGMARSTSRSTFISYQTSRIHTRSVARTITSFLSLPEATHPTPILPTLQRRTRRCRAPQPEEEEGRPAKIRRGRVASPAPVPAPAPTPVPVPAAALPAASPPSSPLANFSPSRHRPSSSPSPPAAREPLPPPTAAYVPAPVPSPTSVFPLRRGESFRPLPSSDERAIAGRFLDLRRDDMHGTRANLVHHSPGWRGPGPMNPSVWQNVYVPSPQQVDNFRQQEEDEIAYTRKMEYQNGYQRSQRQWLKFRMEKKENPSTVAQEARRAELAVAQRDFIRDGTNLNTPSPYRFESWEGSPLSGELGWKWVDESLSESRRDMKKMPKA